MSSGGRSGCEVGRPEPTQELVEVGRGFSMFAPSSP